MSPIIVKESHELNDVRGIKKVSNLERNKRKGGEEKIQAESIVP